MATSNPRQKKRSAFMPSITKAAPESWELRPLKGVGPLDFGMTPKQVMGLLGAPERSEDKPIMDYKREYRGNITCCFAPLKKPRLFRVDFRPPSPLAAKGKNLLAEKDPPGFLATLDKGMMEGNGFQVFPKLGLLLSSYGRKRTPDGKFAIAYGELEADTFPRWTVL